MPPARPPPHALLKLVAETPGEDPLRRLRAWVALLFLLGAVGTAGELVLLEHTESTIQWTPFVALALPVVALIRAHARPGRLALRAVQATMILLAIDGLLGVWFHWRGNIAFELEMQPDLSGWNLIVRSAFGATPALAPGLMAQLGLVGLLYTYRHPALRERTPSMETQP